MEVVIAESLAAVHTHTHTHNYVYQTKRAKYNRLYTQDVKNTSLLSMFNKARKQYLVLRKMKLMCCNSSFF